MPRPRLEDARPRLLAAGLSLFAARGVERVNTNAIARRARLGVGTFYQHFANKFELLEEIQLRTFEGLRQARTGALEALGERADPGDQARATIRAAIRFAARHPAAYRVATGRERFGAAGKRPVLSESTRALARRIEALQAEGRLAANVDATLAARVYASAESGLLLWWLEDPRRADEAALIESLLAVHPVTRAAVPQAA